MRTRALAILVALIPVAAPASAPAQAPGIAQTQGILTIFGGTGVGTGTVTVVDSSLTGTLAVSFHGDPAAGCAARDVCGYSGTILWRPQSQSGELTIFSARRGGSEQVGLSLSGSDSLLPTVSSVVSRARAGAASASCADTNAPDVGGFLPAGGGRVTVRALTSASAVLTTRCAGPLDADVAASLPSVSLPARALARGHRRIDLGGTRSFAAGGFAGTLSSTLALHLGGTTSLSPRQTPPRGRTVAVRVVSAPLRVTGATGMLGSTFAGAGEPDACAPLDSCGLRGALTVRPRPVQADGELMAVGPGRRPLRDFLKALGLGRRGRVRGIQAFGEITWQHGGTLATEVAQAGVCRDFEALGAGGLALDLPGRGVHLLAPDAALHLRCPGPIPAFGSGFLASGALPPDGLARGRFTLGLGGNHAPREDDGYSLSFGGRVALRIQRGRIHQQILREPAGSVSAASLGPQLG